MTTDDGPAALSRRRTAAPAHAYALALVLLAAGGAALLLAYGMPWGSADVPLVAGLGGSTRSQAFAGRDLFPAAAASGWVCLAGVAGIVATRRWGRRLVAILLLAAGILGATAAGYFGLTSRQRLVSAADLVAAPPDAVTSVTYWWLAAVVAGLAVVAAAGMALADGGDWPILGSRYERAVPRELSAWQAQDLGQDPTDDLVE
jgi:hypothetical protein